MRLPLRIGVLSACLMLPVAVAAAEPEAGRPSELVFFLDVLVLVAAGRLMGEAAQRLGQPAVMGQLLAGLLLGPSVLGLLWPDLQHALFPRSPAQQAMLNAVSQLGVLMLLLLTGMETDLKLLRRVGRAAFSVSVAGIMLPFACGFALGAYLPQDMLPHPDMRLVASLFLGTALSISSVKIVAMVVREMDFMRRDLGQVIVSSAVIDDTIGWVIIAITFSLAQHGALDAAGVAQSLIGTAAFLVVSFTVGRRLVFNLIRWTNDHGVGDMPVISLILALMLSLALLTDAIGVHTVLGAFVAGILVGQSPILTRQIDAQLRGLIAGLFMPVFFCMAGLSADLTILRDPTLAALTGGLILIATIGKFTGAFVGGRFGGLTMRESLALGCAMNARGSTEVIVATIGLSMGVLSQMLYTMIVAMAVVTTMAMPPMLRWALRRLPMRPDEQARLEREAFEAKGFLANLERFLLAVDESPNGRFAARLAGILAGARGTPTTVLQLGRDTDRRDGLHETVAAAVKAGAEAGAPKPAKGEPAPGAVEVITRRQHASAKEAVTAEALRGYDLLVIGLAEPVMSSGAFRPPVAQAAAAFDGPIAVVVARGRHLERPLEVGFSILLPITGTGVSRRAAEVALALGRTSRRPVVALHVTSAGSGSRNLRREEVVLNEVAALAGRFDTSLRTTIRFDDAPDEAILREARGGGHDLIVMGVNRREGEVLFFGNVAQAVLQRGEASLLFVAD
jgi:Kef-type K+ transport system membrane component KefB/nucleotide-binding universal stress UspA family protein